MKRGERAESEQIDFQMLSFKIDLLKTDEINLDYILALILEKSKENDDVESLKQKLQSNQVKSRHKSKRRIDYELYKQ